MSNDMTQPPADVRERVAKEVYVWEHVRRGAEESWARQRWQTETDGMRNLYFEAADRILALIRTPRGDGEDTIPVSALRSEIAQLKAHGLLPYLAWAQLCALAGGGPVGEDTPAALRSEAQGEDTWTCESCGEPIEDDDEYVTWADGVRTHRRCTEGPRGRISGTRRPPYRQERERCGMTWSGT